MTVFLNASTISDNSGVLTCSVCGGTKFSGTINKTVHGINGIKPYANCDHCKASANLADTKL